MLVDKCYYLEVHPKQHYQIVATGLSSFGYINFSGGSRRLVVVFPSASNQGGKPVSMYDGVPPDSTGTANEYYVYEKDENLYLVQLEQVYITSILKMQ